MECFIIRIIVVILFGAVDNINYICRNYFRIMKNKVILAAIVFFAMLTAACNSDRVFVERVEIPNMQWHMDSLVNISVPVEDPSQVFDIMIAVRSNVYFQSRNLWLFINTYSPQHVVETDTLECIFADEQGHTTGDAMGDIIDYEIPFKTGVRFPSAGTYKFSLQHGMRLETLPCIDEVGEASYEHKYDDSGSSCLM